MVLKPPRLRPGDLIGLIAPASTPEAGKTENGIRYLERRGYRVTLGKHVKDVRGFLAGTDAHRAEDLNNMINDKNVRAIIAIRGGYGTPRILSLVDYRALKNNPKIIVGYSDITALQMAIFRKIRLVTFSGPMAGVEMGDTIDPYAEEHFWRVITANGKVGTLDNPAEEPITVLKEGKGTGVIVGGNFATLVSLMSTKFMPALARSVLVLEDVDEAPHRVDRMFSQLLKAGILNKLAGLVIGKFTDCVPSDPSKPFLTINQIVKEYARQLKCPIVSNFQYGHIPKKLTIPFGLRTRLDTAKRTIEVLESAVT